MEAIELIPLPGGHWAAHATDQQIGSSARSRGKAIATLAAWLDRETVRLEHPEYLPGGRAAYPLPEPGHYGF